MAKAHRIYPPEISREEGRNTTSVIEVKVQALSAETTDIETFAKPRTEYIYDSRLYLQSMSTDSAVEMKIATKEGNTAYFAMMRD
ncbi:hypothetical protein P0Y43_03945 [Pseudomonas entomophila]|uniref:hypothetical protein n=1 Tax=Pseudomonas entomophila TaxID=312306 RepID=UPI0023D89C6A|nr:hypothetical protein [Pseudomonas entomophila]MDF0729881.1 hypothetical protein [Pseudomonas entomophila]